MPLTGDPEADFLTYGNECARRSKQAAEAGRRQGLEARLRDRRIAEEQGAASAVRRSDAEQELRAAAHACDLPRADTSALDDLALAIKEWLDQRSRSIGQRQQAVAEFAVLEQLLDGGTLDELKAEADRLANAAQVAAHGLDQAEIESTDLDSDSMTTLREFRATAQEARDRVTELQSTLEERERSVPSVATAEETLAQVQASVDRLERLSRILSVARAFLVQAQDTVHRSIAPRLAAAIAPNLADLSAGRYTEVMVDPDDLQVRVRAPGGVWREADRLSHGTAEQVYLLLRAALAQYLVTTGESCPLILDDPTAYADDARTSAVLEVLHQVRAERQVVVFSHDTNVLAWARNALNGPRDKIIELAELTPA
jgi:DNA repair exonuclease SbcCD ATPase subunit